MPGMRVDAGDLMVEQHAVGLELVENLTEVGRIVLDADVLHHAQRADAVESGFRHIAIIHETDFGEVLKAFAFDPFLAPRDLLVREGHADYVNAAPCGDDLHGPPAAADIQQPVSGLEAELVEHQVELGFLRGLQGVGRLVEQGARVRHGRPENEPVEVIRLVVMVADGRRIAGLAVRQQAFGCAA